MSKTAITSLAILKVNWDTYKKSYTENFTPLVAECIRLSDQPFVSLSEIQGRMLAEFGLRIPSNSLKVILSHVQRQGYVRREHGTYVPMPSKLQTLRVQPVRQQILSSHDATITNLREFCRTRYSVNWTSEEAEDALLLYLKDHDLDILLAAAEGTPIPAVRRKISNARFLVSAFAIHVQREEPDAFSYLEDVVKGHLLANALVFPDVSAVARKFRRTKVFLDTRVILNALGYRGIPFRATGKDLLDLLYELGADIRCFRHTYDETVGILYAVSKALSTKSLAELYEAVGRTFYEQGASESDVMLAIATLERDLKRLHVEIEDKPSYEHKYQLDEAELDRMLERNVRYTNQPAKVRDVDSLSSIYKFRKGRDYTLLEDCRAFFVTTNFDLVKTSKTFFNAYQSVTSAPIAITERNLANILWLKKPIAVPELPRKQIIADSYAALEPPGKLWRKFLAETKKLQARGDITAEDYYVFRTATETRSLLMEATLGQEEALVEGTAQEILTKYKENIRAAAEAKREEAERRSKMLENRLRGVGDRIETIADWCARKAAKMVFGLVVLALLVGSYASFVSLSIPKWLRYIVLLGQVLLLIISLANLIFGVTVLRIIRKVEVQLKGFIKTQLGRLFEI